MPLRPFIVGLAALAALLAALAVWNYFGPHMAPRQTAAEPSRPTDESDRQTGGMRVTGPTQISLVDDEGNTVWEADFAGDMELDQDRGLLAGADVTCRILLGGEQALTVEAGQFAAEHERKSLRFSQGAEARLEPDGSLFTADSFEWAVEQRRLVARGGVEVRHKQAVLRGDELEADLMAQKARVKGHAVAAYGG